MRTFIRKQTKQRRQRRPFGRRGSTMNKKKRVCLRCRNVFQSTHIGNRICGKCAAINAAKMGKMEGGRHAGRPWSPERDEPKGSGYVE